MQRYIFVFVMEIKVKNVYKHNINASVYIVMRLKCVVWHKNTNVFVGIILMVVKHEDNVNKDNTHVFVKIAQNIF